MIPSVSKEETLTPSLLNWKTKENRRRFQNSSIKFPQHRLQYYLHKRTFEMKTECTWDLSEEMMPLFLQVFKHINKAFKNQLISYNKTWHELPPLHFFHSSQRTVISTSDQTPLVSSIRALAQFLYDSWMRNSGSKHPHDIAKYMIMKYMKLWIL